MGDVSPVSVSLFLEVVFHFPNYFVCLSDLGHRFYRWEICGMKENSFHKKKENKDKGATSDGKIFYI